MLKTVEFKLYPTTRQKSVLDFWRRTCCWVFNQTLEHRIKAYKRRNESISYNTQSGLLTKWRKSIPKVQSVPVEFSRDALRRVDRGMKAFFRRVKSGQKPGFPRFKSQNRYVSMEYLATGNYLEPHRIRVPNLGYVKVRFGKQDFSGAQKLLRLIKRASGWYGQVPIEDHKPPAFKGFQ